MQPTLCSKCKKNVAVVFISRQNEKGEMVNEGLCLKCAAQLGLPQVEEMMKRMGISPEDLENINNEMMQAFGGAEELSDMPAPQDEDDEDDGESGKTATFPFLNRLFSGETAKSGVDPDALPQLLETAAACAHIRVRGLMAIPPVAETSDGNHAYFTKMHELFVDIGRKKYDNASMDFLSMGMSGDFEDAIAAGANMVRVGSAIFGARDYSRH